MRGQDGHTSIGVKWQILQRENFTPFMPLCIKVRHGCRYVHNDKILRHGVWRKIPLLSGVTMFIQYRVYIKGEFYANELMEWGYP